MNTHISSANSLAWARRLKVRHLEYFLILRNAGTLSEAARALHMTQSAMSHWLNELETLLGVRLVVRGRRIRFTPEGEVLLRLATRLLGDIARTQDELELLAQGAPASLHVGSVTAGLAHLIPNSICSFQMQVPQIAIHMTEGAFSLLLERLEARELDIVVGSIDARAYAAGLAHEVLFEDRIVAIVGLQHPIRQKAKPLWSDLVPFPWIMPEKNTLMRNRLDTVLLENGGAGVRPRLETASIIIIETVLRQTDYVAVCSASLGAHLHRLGLVHALPLTAGFGPVGAVYRERDSHPVLGDFLAELRRQANTLRADESGLNLAL